MTRLWTINDIVDYTGLSENTIRTYRRSGVLPKEAETFGNKPLFDPDAIKAWRPPKHEHDETCEPMVDGVYYWAYECEGTPFAMRTDGQHKQAVIEAGSTSVKCIFCSRHHDLALITESRYNEYTSDKD